MTKARGIVGRSLLAAALLTPTALVSGLVLRRELSAKVVVSERTLPKSLEGWEGESVPLTESEKSMLDSPAASQMLYRDAAGNLVQVLVLQVNNTQNAHDPKLCMAGSGYTLEDETVIPSPWVDGRSAYPVTRAKFTKESSLVTMFYWLQTGSGSVADMSSGLKMEGIKRALKGSTLKGLAIRVIALPNAMDPSRSTDEKTAEKLWGAIERQIEPNSMLSRM